MNISKRMLQKKFRKQKKEKVVYQTPNRTYFIGEWQQDGYKIKAEIIETNGKKVVFRQKRYKKKVIVYQATYLTYEVKVWCQGILYQRRYLY